MSLKDFNLQNYYFDPINKSKSDKKIGKHYILPRLRTNNDLNQNNIITFSDKSKDLTFRIKNNLKVNNTFKTEMNPKINKISSGKSNENQKTDCIIKVKSTTLKFDNTLNKMRCKYKTFINNKNIKFFNNNKKCQKYSKNNNIHLLNIFQKNNKEINSDNFLKFKSNPENNKNNKYLSYSKLENTLDLLKPEKNLNNPILMKKENDNQNNHKIKIYDDISSNKDNDGKYSPVKISNSPKLSEKNNLYKPCFICDKNYRINKLILCGNKKHFLCKNCLKIYYETNIRRGNFNLKCPDVNCKGKINEETLKNIINKKYYEVIQDRINRNLSSNEELEKNNINLDNIKIYNNKHVLTINDAKNFDLYSKNKELFCCVCSVPHLFYAANKYFIRCLNCHSKICKYCFKEFNDGHLDILNKNHCKVCFKSAEIKINKNRKNFFIFFMQIITIISMYFLMIIGLSIYIVDFIRFIFGIKPNKKSEKTSLKHVLFFVLYLITSLIITPILFIFIPYFPIIVSIFER